MTEKVGLIKNPLTIIAIFAGIAEVSGTIVLPFVAEQNQVLFIWFLIVFPTVLVLSFFLTLNFNNKVLYAPSDYQDEGNYLLSNRYNAATLINAPVKESYHEAVLNFEKSINDLRSRVDILFEKEIFDGGKEPDTHVEVDTLLSKKSLYTYKVISDFSNADNFVNKMASLGYEITLYDSPRGQNTDISNTSLNHQSIWLGSNIDLDVAKEIISYAKKYFPFIKYICLAREGDIPRSILNEIFIGGSTKSAIELFNSSPIDKAGFERISKATTLSELHAILDGYITSTYDM